MITPLFFCFGFFDKESLYSYARVFHFPTRTCVQATLYIFVYKILPPRWSFKTSKGEPGTSIINYTKEEVTKRQRKKVS